MGSGPRFSTAFAFAFAALTLTSLLASTASAYEVKHADSGAVVRWDEKNIGLIIDSSVDEVPGAGAAITSAMAVWSGREGAPTISVSEREQALSPGYDGKNVVFYNQAGFTPASGEALAITVLTFDSDTGKVLDADIVLNGKYPLGVIASGDSVTPKTSGSDPATTGVTYDVSRVIAHEMGHVLALSDELGMSTSLMYPWVAADTSLQATPASDDLEGIKLIYAATPAAWDTDASKGGCNTSGANTATDGVFAFGTLAGALALARSRSRSRDRARARARARILSSGGVVLTVLAAGLLSSSADASSVPSTTSQSDTLVTARRVSTSTLNGLFTTDVEACGEGACFHVNVLGGRIGHIEQVVGGMKAPAVGERMRVKVRADD